MRRISIEEEKAIEDWFYAAWGPIMQRVQEQVDRRMLQVYYALLVDLHRLELELTGFDSEQPRMPENDLKGAKNLIDDLSPTEQHQLIGYLMAKIYERPPDDAIGPTGTLVIGDESG